MMEFLESTAKKPKIIHSINSDIVNDETEYHRLNVTSLNYINIVINYKSIEHDCFPRIDGLTCIFWRLFKEHNYPNYVCFFHVVCRL